MAPEIQTALWILLLPLAAFAIQILFGRRLPRQGDWLPTGAMFVCMMLSLWLFVTRVLASPAGMEPVAWSREWWAVGSAEVGAFSLSFGVLVDNLTTIMLVVVTVVSFLVHLYSMGYMHGDPRYSRFFAYLALFTFSMLGLCITSNLLFLFMFWELVGLCSYFLIGFWFEKKSASDAAKKAFLTTRVGDLGFFLAITIIAAVAGSLELKEIFQSVADHKWEGGLLVLAGLLLFLGPVGKSAQFPLHVWLPDAMEGPTPVSALIHAATMVAAGVYLVARMFPFFAGPAFFEGGDVSGSQTLFVIALVGGFTALFAATIALVQTDIKKVLAYSTVSQLGYMMLGIGAGSFVAGMFHLFTHAFFKALLFLGSGSVIHAVHSQEMGDMGGLWKKMPITAWTFLIGTLALAGLPFVLSGFWSKEAILTQALALGIHKGSVLAYLPFVFGILTAGLTAFYMGRCYILTFLGKPKDHHKYEHAHESPKTMTIPLLVLTVGAIFAAGLPGGIGSHWFENRTKKEITFDKLGIQARAGHGTPTPHGEPAAEHAAAMHHAHELAHNPTMLLSIAMAVLGMGLSWVVFAGRLKNRDLVGQRGPLAACRGVLQNLYYIDRIYSKTIIALVMMTKEVFFLFDKFVVDGLVNLWGWITRVVAYAAGSIDHGVVDGAVRATGSLTLRAGDSTRKIQTGRIPDYVFLSVFSLALIFALVAIPELKEMLLRIF
jgi:NADH-quinone oxidoreductase subunit L